MDVAKVTHQREIDKAPGKVLLPTVPLSCLRWWQLSRATSIVHGSWHDLQQVLQAAGLLIGVTSSSLLIGRAPVPQDAV